MEGQLNAQEADLFGILVDLLSEGEVERTKLRVKVGARGAELGRAYKRLQGLGLFIERQNRPNFLRRLFGAETTLMVGLSELGRELAAQIYLEAHPPEPPAVEAAEPEHLPPDAPVAMAEPVPVPPAAPVAEVSPKKAAVKQPKKRRLAMEDFTETLGGAPLDDRIDVPVSDQMDGLAELLGLYGFELTDAGRLLAARRWAENRSDGEVALEIVTASLAHIARLRASGTTGLNEDRALQLIAETEEMFQPLAAAGMMDSADLTEALDRMRGFISGPVAHSDVEAYLADPLRGFAPPAIGPDSVYLYVNTEEA